MKFIPWILLVIVLSVVAFNPIADALGSGPKRHYDKCMAEAQTQWKANRCSEQFIKEVEQQ
ncbi:MAG TPA: hypothetical protein VH088_05605 [Terriglobales bacterium]|jgi:hypothetical protein|nr:hypothetical protein [Terriglobales bacterium]